ncbi:homeodomain-interacting protein kinase 2-like [Nelusetta ayraudi]|uniref:homeodomain-interacting protein kinase 2-like n=1 Tax=Nelusetta ayraudi TaxID=303726 RepID=UPI003F718EF9
MKKDNKMFLKMAGKNSPARMYYFNRDDKICEGYLLGKHHRVIRFLGKGSYGFVYKCWNDEGNQVEAVKLIKKDPEFIQKVKVEIDNLKRLQCLDPDTSNIVKWYEFFFHKETICLTFELLDVSLWDYMKERLHLGLPISEMRSIIHQIATALTHLNNIGVVHADLKPNNVMIVNRHQQPFKVKLIDFGLSYSSSGPPGLVVQTLFYRAPEVILGICFSEVIDMWSLGVLSAELATGRHLYPGDAGYDVLNLIVKTQGQPADYLLDRGQATNNFFIQTTRGQPRWFFLRPRHFELRTGYRAKDRRNMKLRSLDDLRKFMLMDTNNQSDQLLLVDLIKKMMDLDPERRIKPQEVLEHPFLVTNPTQSSGDKTVARDNAGQLAASHHTAVPASQRVKAGGVVQQDTNTEQDGCFSCLAVQLADTYYRYIADNRLNNISVLFTVRGSGSPIVTFHNLD